MIGTRASAAQTNTRLNNSDLSSVDSMSVPGSGESSHRCSDRHRTRPVSQPGSVRCCLESSMSRTGTSPAFSRARPGRRPRRLPARLGGPRRRVRRLAGRLRQGLPGGPRCGDDRRARLQPAFLCCVAPSGYDHSAVLLNLTEGFELRRLPAGALRRVCVPQPGRGRGTRAAGRGPTGPGTTIQRRCVAAPRRR